MKNSIYSYSKYVLTSICFVSLLAGCANAPDKTSSTSSDSKSTTESQTVTNAENKTENKTATTENVDKNTNKAINPQFKIDINKLPDNMPIYIVGNTKITVADYKRMLKVQQLQLNSVISSDIVARTRLISEANKRGVTLTSEEQAKLLNAAKSEQMKGKDFQEFLKSKNITEEQYNKEVSDTGLAYKMSNLLIQEGLLPELVNRELLGQGAISEGFNKQAQSRYLTIKNSKLYDQLKQFTGLSTDALKDEIVKAELAKMQVEKLEKSINASNSEIKNYYDKNKSLLKHGERIRLSTILIAAPERDLGPIQSIKTQVLKANPKLQGKELDATAAQFMAQQEARARVLLAEAMSGANFAKLANENTDDLQARARKNGGDLGFQEKQQVQPELIDILWTKKAGTVLPQIIRTPLGFQIIKVTAKEKAGYMPLAEVKPLLEMKVKQDKLQFVVQNWLNQRKLFTKVEFAPQFLAAAGKTDNSTKTNTVN